MTEQTLTARSDDSLPWQVAKLAVWPLLEQILAFMVGFVDTAVAGHLSVAATNAVGVAAYMNWFMGLMIASLGVGFTALVSRSTGAGRVRRSNQILSMSLSASLGWGICIGIVFYVLAPFIGALSGLNGESLELCTMFLRIVALAAPFNTILSIASACLRGSGDTRSPFFVMVAVNIVNVAGTVLLSAEWSPIGGMGLRGVAIGTTIAWGIGCACILWTLYHRRSAPVIERRFLRPRWPLLKRILRVGIPNLLESLGQWSGNFMLVMLVGRLPNHNALGAHIVAIRIEAMSFLPGLALGIAAATLAGQYLGAGKPQMARKAVLWCWLFSTCVMTFLGVLFVSVPEVFVRMMTDKPEFLAISPQLLFITGWVQIAFSSYMVFSGGLRGAGDTRSAMLLIFGTTFLVRLPLAWWIGIKMGYGLTGMWIGMCAEMVIRGILFSARFLSGRWMDVKV